MPNTITVWVFDSSTREYLHPEKCYPDPRNPEQHILPTYYLPTEPPAAAANQIVVAGESDWAIEADYRGQVFYDAAGNTHPITEIGVTPASEWLTEAPLTIEQQRARMVVKRGQGRIALLDYGYLDAVEAYVNAPECPVRVRIAYQDAQDWERLSETTAAMMLVLALTDAEADALFTYAKDVTY